MGNFAAFAANARDTKTEAPARTIRACLQWVIVYAEHALTKPAVAFERQAIEALTSIGDQLAKESEKPVPAVETFFAVSLAGTLLKHAGTTPGTENATRLQCLIATLLPLVRVDLARVIGAERIRS